MNYRLFTSLLLMAVLTALYLWFCPPDDTAATKSTTTPGTEAGQRTGPLGSLKIL